MANIKHCSAFVSTNIAKYLLVLCVQSHETIIQVKIIPEPRNIAELKFRENYCVYGFICVSQWHDIYYYVWIWIDCYFFFFFVACIIFFFLVRYWYYYSMSLKRVSSIVLLLIVCSRHNRLVNRVIVCVSAVCVFFSSLPNECIIRLYANQKQAKKKMTQNKNRLIKLCDYEFPTELNTMKIKLSLFLLSFIFIFTLLSLQKWNQNIE